MSATHVIEVTEQTFVEKVVDRSHEVPVVVDFWADWCGPCRALGPILERLADEAQGAWVLAKVDVDANPGLASTFGVRGIPAVRAWKDGREAADFVGALPEPQVRQWLDQLGPTPAETLWSEASAALAKEDLAAAKDALLRVIEADPNHAEARSEIERLELLERAGGLDETEARSRLAADPSDVEAATALADVLAAKGELDAAFDALIEVVRRCTGDDRERARTHLLRLLDTIPADDPRALRARRSLSLALF